MDARKKGFSGNYLESIKNAGMELNRLNKIDMYDAGIKRIKSSINYAGDLKKSEILAEFYYQSLFKIYKNVVNKLFLALQISKLKDEDIKVNIDIILSESVHTPKLSLPPLPLEYRPQIQTTAPNA